MRDLFPWRFRISESEISSLWGNATFIFDTNFLLDLYRVSHSTAESFLNILDKIHDRIWIPYQVIDEFTLRRDEIRHKESESFKKALIALEKWEAEQSQFKDLRKCLKESGRLVSSELEYLFDEQEQYLSVISEVSEKFRSTIQNISEEHSFSSFEEDYISNKILALLDSSKVGRPFGEDILEKIYDEGRIRYDKKQPPGFEDSDKEDNKKYGDLIIWKEILEFSKLNSSPIIFVTGDKKDDWWTKKNGKILAPHTELRREFYEYTNQLFWMYTPTLFLEIASGKLMVEVNEKSLQESNAIAEIDLDESETLKSTSPNVEVDGASSSQFDNSRNPENQYSQRERQVRPAMGSALGLRPFELPDQVRGVTNPIVRQFQELDKLNQRNRLMTTHIGLAAKYSQLGNSITESLVIPQHLQSIFGQVHQSEITRLMSDVEKLSRRFRYM